MKTSPLLALALILGAALLAGCSHPGDSGSDAPQPGPQQAVIDTSHGWIRVDLLCEEAPVTVENFREYANASFYAGTIFHRIISDFMVQGGGFTADGEQKQTREPIPLEAGVSNERGTLAMARQTPPNTATSQFFINVVDNNEAGVADGTGKTNLDPGPGRDGYAVFGRVVEGMDVVDAIRDEPTDSRDWPADPPVIRDVTVGTGCDEVQPQRGLEAGLIVDSHDGAGNWTARVSADPDYIPLWVRNLGNQADRVGISVQAPEGWEVAVAEAVHDLEPGGRTGDSAATYLTVTNASATTEEPRLLVRVTSRDDPEASTSFGILVAVAEPFAERVSAPGDQVAIAYAGSFDSGEEFDSGSFSAEVDGQQTVRGFAAGLMGLELEETAQIRFPPDLAYGYTSQGQPRLAGQWLNFEITLQSFD